MNEDDMGVHEEPAGDELDRMLARYARVRLDSSLAATRRARSAVMEEAWRRHLAAPAAVAVPPARRRGLFAGWGARRLGATLAAAVMAGLLVGSTVFAASRAGGPLYGARLAIETLTLPGDAEARLEAELASAQTRLAEAVDASTRADQAALDASLEAYGEALRTLEAATGSDAERALEAVALHRSVLEAVMAEAPAAAMAGLTRAIAQSDALILRLNAALGGDGPGSPGNGGLGGQPSSKPGAAPTPRPEATPRATKVPKPEATPRATKVPKPEATPKPERTPKPRPTPAAPDVGNSDREGSSP